MRGNDVLVDIGDPDSSTAEAARSAVGDLGRQLEQVSHMACFQASCA
jgi:hypothetical protein